MIEVERRVVHASAAQEDGGRPGLDARRPVFSVITVVLNDAKGLRRTAASVCGQERADHEWIVVDGGSTDGTVAFLEARPAAEVTWITERDTGIYDAMNKGLDLARGDYVVFMNAGDTFSTVSVLEEVAALLAPAAPPDVVFGGATLVFPGGLRWYRRPRPVEPYIRHGLPSIHQATYYRRRRLEGIRYDASYRICGDYYLVAKLFAEGASVSYLDASLADFHVGGASFRERKSLFLEPYRIQRDVLKLGLLPRLSSVGRRFFSTVAVTVLARVGPLTRLRRPRRAP